jgi:hypothetical protein
VSRAVAKTWKPGDSVVLTSLDHDANYTPWRMAAEETGCEIRVAEFDEAAGVLDPDAVVDLIDRSTRLVAVGLASNALGTVVHSRSGGWVAPDRRSVEGTAFVLVTISVTGSECDRGVVSARA